MLSILPGPSEAGACICATKPLAFGEGKGQLHYVSTNQSVDTGAGTLGCCNSCRSVEVESAHGLYWIGI